MNELSHYLSATPATSKVYFAPSWRDNRSAEGRIGAQWPATRFSRASGFSERIVHVVWVIFVLLYCIVTQNRHQHMDPTFLQSQGSDRNQLVVPRDGLVYAPPQPLVWWPSRDRMDQNEHPETNHQQIYVWSKYLMLSIPDYSVGKKWLWV